MKLKLSFPVALLALSLGGLLLMNCGNEALETRPLLPAPDDYNFLHPASIPCGEENEDLSYKVPLSEAQEERAMRVYRESIVILAHVHCVEPWDFEEMLQGGITAVILKVDTDGMNVRNGTRAYNQADEDWMPRATKSIRRIQDMAAQPESKIIIVRTVKDLDRAKQEGKVGVIFSFEGALPAVGRAGKLENVKYFYDLGSAGIAAMVACPLSQQAHEPPRTPVQQVGRGSDRGDEPAGDGDRPVPYLRAGVCSSDRTLQGPGHHFPLQRGGPLRATGRTRLRKSREGQSLQRHGPAQ